MPLRVLMLSADVGEGHAAAARAIGAELRALVPDVEVVLRNDFAVLGRPLERLMTRGFRFHLGRVGWSYDLTYRFFMAPAAAPARAFARWALRLLGGRALLREIERLAPDAIVSTYPVHTTVLGELRRAGLLRVPVAARVVELENFHFIVHPGVDRHLVLHAEAIAGVQAIAGRGGVVHVRPPVPESFLAPLPAAEARRRCGLPAGGPVVLVSGGGWGMGTVEDGVEVALATAPDAHVVCLAGRSAELRERLGVRFAGESRVEVLGFVARERVGELLAAADALVHATAGMTVLEARLRGCPAICFGFPIGHVRANARALSAHGLAARAESRAELGVKLRQALAAGRRPPLRVDGLPSAGEAILAMLRRER